MSDKKISELPPASNLGLDDLLPIVHNGVTSKVTLRSLINEMQLYIPQPRIKIMPDKKGDYYGHDMVYAYWEGSDEKFAKYNPQYFLYRYKRAELRTALNKATGQMRRTQMKKRFVHPSHQHGIDHYRVEPGGYAGTKYFDGEQFATHNGDHGKMRPRNTEWDLAKKPMVETHLDLGPWTYFRTENMSDPFLGIDPTRDFPTEFQPMPRGTGTNRSRMLVFKVRIAIDNPNPDAKEPKLFGPFSETFILYPHKDKGVWTNLRYFLGPEASPRLRQKI